MYSHSIVSWETTKARWVLDPNHPLERDPCLLVSSLSVLSIMESSELPPLRILVFWSMNVSLFIQWYRAQRLLPFHHTRGDSFDGQWIDRDNCWCLAIMIFSCLDCICWRLPVPDPFLGAPRHSSRYHLESECIEFWGLEYEARNWWGEYYYSYQYP